MTDGFGRTTPEGSDPAQLPPQPYPPQGFPQQQYPPQPYPPQGFPPSRFPPLPYPPEVYPPVAQPPQGPVGPPPRQPHSHRAQPPQPPGERRLTSLVVGGLAGVLALAAVGVGVLALRGSGDGGKHQAAPGVARGLVTPDASLTPSPETPAPNPSTPGTRIGSSVALSKGDCIQTLPKGQNLLTVTLVPCTSPHEAQVGSTFSPKGSTYPGGSALAGIVRSECPIRLRHAISANAPALSWSGYYPEAVEWDGGDHSLKCLVTSRNGKPLTRSVIG